MKYLIALVIAAFSSMTFAQSGNTKIEKQITKVMMDQAEAWNRGDIDGFMRGYWKSDKLLFVSGTNVTRGWQPTLDRYKKSYDTRAKMGSLTFSDLEVTVLSADAAVVLGSWSLTA